ncbi:hypothetical protein B0A58_15100, partial [Flavobacterium branchiophilum NBRC 15030 = ATCC 35035]
NNYYTTAEGLGKVNVYIEGDLTDAECAAKLKAEVGTITENIYIGSQENYARLTELTNLELDIPTNVKKIYFTGIYEKLKTIKIKGHGSMPLCEIYVSGGKLTESILVEGITELKYMYAGLNGVTISQFCNVEIKDLQEVSKGFAFTGYPGPNILNKQFTLKCNDLKYVNKNFIYDIEATGGSIGGHFTSFSMTGLKDMSNARLGINPIGNQVTLPALEKVYELNCLASNNYNKNLNIINLPVLTTIDNIICSGFLYTINLPVLSIGKGISIGNYTSNHTMNFNAPVLNYCLGYTSNNNLNSSDVNAILNKFLTIQPLSGKYIDLYYEPAPTGQGIIDKQALINQGNNVLTN